jgi:hypothetical protein
MSRIQDLDFLGLLLGAATWVSFTLALTMAGGQWPWNDGRTIATFVVFGAIIVGYILQQRFSLLTTPEKRSFPVPLLMSRTQLLVFIATAANASSLFVVMYFLPIYFQFVHDDSALMAAARLLPFVAVTVVLNLVVGHLLPRLRYYQPIYVASGILVLLGGALLTVYLSPSTPQEQIYGFSVIVAAGTGITLQTCYPVAAARAAAAGRDPAQAIALQNVSQIGGSVMALVIAGQIFQSSALKNLTASLAGSGLTDYDIQQIVAGAQSTLYAGLSEEMKQAATAAITKAMQTSFVLVIVAGAAILVSGAAMKIEKLFEDGEEETAIVAG